MVNAADTFGIDPATGHPERALALGYAPAASRDGVVALFALDAMLAKLTRGTREPIVAQLRLAWWREALERIDTAPVAGQPIIAALRETVLPSGVDGVMLAGLVDGWEALIAGDVAMHGHERGRRLFEMAAIVLGADDPWVGDAGEGWALADLALTSPDQAVATAARSGAGPLLKAAREPRASRAARPLGALASIARMDLEGGAAGSPRRVARLLRYRLIGR